MGRYNSAHSHTNCLVLAKHFPLCWKTRLFLLSHRHYRSARLLPKIKPISTIARGWSELAPLEPKTLPGV